MVNTKNGSTVCWQNRQPGAQLGRTVVALDISEAAAAAVHLTFNHNQLPEFTAAATTTAAAEAAVAAAVLIAFAGPVV